jgi:N-acetylglutamate synthase-like GNAT family acetyltransferase
MDLVIREATLRDIPIIQQIASLTWPETFVDVMSAAQMRYMQWMMYRSEVLARQMESEDHQFFIAENGKAIGFAGTSPFAYGGDERANYWKLHKLYVLPYVQKTGAGKALMEKVMAVARENGATSLLLNVNRDNKAVSYYQKQGFSVVESGDFDIGAGFFMNDYVMAKPI